MEETLLSLLVGVGLSAACGFRIFIPLFLMGVANHAGHLTLSPEFDWIGTDAALIAFGAATVLEISAYYVPWLDNLLDSVATPVAMIAGTIVTASMVTDVSPFLKWTLAVVAGGGTAGLVQTGTVIVRGASTLGSGGLANPLVATAELGGSFLMASVAILAPVVGAALLVGMAGFGAWKVTHRQDIPPVLDDSPSLT